MAERERDDHSGIETTGHEWDGIKELDSPLPRWWLWVWYGTIIIAIVYWVLMPAWPGITGFTRGVLGQSDRQELSNDLRALEAIRGAGAARLRSARAIQTCATTSGSGAVGWPTFRRPCSSASAPDIPAHAERR